MEYEDRAHSKETLDFTYINCYHSILSVLHYINITSIKVLLSTPGYLLYDQWFFMFLQFVTFHMYNALSLLSSLKDQIENK